MFKFLKIEIIFIPFDYKRILASSERMKKNKNNRLSTFLTNCHRILSCYFYLSLELLAVKTYFFNRILTQMRRIYYVNAVKIADVKSKDKVLFIGSGILPSQCIIIAEETGANVVGIDNSKKASFFLSPRWIFSTLHSTVLPTSLSHNASMIPDTI